VVLVGHSYGGAVISQTSAGMDNVTALVYLAAFGLEEGESCASVQQPFPPSLLASASYPAGYDAPGAPQGPDLYITKERFRETFCTDVPVDVADVMLATQRPLSLAALTENATAAGWKTKLSWYLVSEHDNARADALRAWNADVIVGDLTNPLDVGAAMFGITRIFFNWPGGAGHRRARRTVRQSPRPAHHRRTAALRRMECSQFY
jgi:pimeloyl-ACP methyl ester carboxylesterase